jgi:hypothetical protein
MLRLNNLMMHEKNLRAPRPKDKKELEAQFDQLPEVEVIASDSLSSVITSKRSKAGVKSRDLAMEAQPIAGMMALHTTSWDWLNPSLKNAARDLEPCIKAIAVERWYLSGYRPKILSDTYVGAFRRLLEQVLGALVKKVYTIDPVTHKLLAVQVWEWWDGLLLHHTQLDPNDVLMAIQNNTLINHQQTQARLEQENEDRDAIEKLVAYFTNLPCVRASDDAKSLPSADVMEGFEQAIKVSHCFRRGYSVIGIRDTTMSLHFLRWTLF